jgi:hypothetical protein
MLISVIAILKFHRNDFLLGNNIFEKTKMSIFLVIVYYVSRFINAILVTNFIRHERSETLI